MYTVRLNDVNIQVRGQSVFVLDVFGDMSEAEMHSMIGYLAEEGFINPEKDVNVFVKSKSFICVTNQKEGKKKS